MDGNIYHGKCLGFCKDTCFHIQSDTIPDWMCPTCSREVFPCYDNIPDLSHVKCICYNCRLSRGESGLTQNFNPLVVYITMTIAHFCIKLRITKIIK